MYGEFITDLKKIETKRKKKKKRKMLDPRS